MWLTMTKVSGSKRELNDYTLQRELVLFNVITTSVKISEVGFPPRKYIPLSGHHQDKRRQPKPT